MRRPLGSATLRERIKEHCGSASNILILRRAPRFGSHLFVADCLRRRRLVRMLGAIDGTGRVMEQSAMDLLQPERLVFGYERLMLAAFALARAPRRALLLGLGGGAMCRHLRAYLPEIELVIVEREPLVRELARKYFHIRRPVLGAEATAAVAEARAEFDVILVDLYDGAGAVEVRERFWRDCARALRPGGALAINWAEFVGEKTMAAEAKAATAALGRSAFLIEQHARPNVVQLAPTDRAVRLSEVQERFRDFARARRLPRADRDEVARADLRTRYPVI